MVCVITPEVSYKLRGFHVLSTADLLSTAGKVVINLGDKISNVLKIRTSIRIFEFLDFVATKKKQVKEINQMSQQKRR